MELFIDTETSDTIKWKLPIADPVQPWMVQIGAILSDQLIKYAEINLLIRANGRDISEGAQGAHNISVKMTDIGGVREKNSLNVLRDLYEQADVVVMHNVSFDKHMILSVAKKANHTNLYDLADNKPYICTMDTTTDLLKMRRYPGAPDYKWPKLQELHNCLFGYDFVGAHDAMNDVRATRKCFYELLEREKYRDLNKGLLEIVYP